MAAVEGTVIACHTENQFDAQMAKGKETGKLVIIDFMTTWCPGCQAMAPVYVEFANKYPAAVFLQVNCEELVKVAKKYEIHSIPTFCFVRNGEPLESVETVDPDELEDAIKKYYVAGAPPASVSASASASA